MNMQPWTFAVITGSERLDAYAERAKKHVLSHVPVSQLSIPAAYMLDDPNLSIFYHAPVLILVIAKADEPQAREDCCLAAHALMLAARDADLGTCWVGFGRAWLNLPETKSELGLPPDCHVVAPIVLGHPMAWPEGRARNTPSIHWVP
jgi:nitroreductase